MNNALHRGITNFGGRQAFLNSRHQRFCQVQRQFERAVGTTVKQARASADAVCIQGKIDVIGDLQELMRTGYILEHGEIVDVFLTVRSG